MKNPTSVTDLINRLKPQRKRKVDSTVFNLQSTSSEVTFVVENVEPENLLLRVIADKPYNQEVGRTYVLHRDSPLMRGIDAYAIALMSIGAELTIERRRRKIGKEVIFPYIIVRVRHGKAEWQIMSSS